MPYRIERLSFIPRCLKRVATHIGRRGIILLFFGFLYMTVGRGWMVAPPQESRNYAGLLYIADFHAWGLVQLGVGILMCGGAIWKKTEAAAFGLSAALSSFFGLAALSLYLPGGLQPSPSAPRLVITYFFYSIFILIVSGWPEKETVIVIPEQKDSDAS